MLMFPFLQHQAGKATSSTDHQYTPEESLTWPPTTLARRRQAMAAWTTSLKTAERLAMPYERGRAHYELGRHLPPGRPGRGAHLRRACELFAATGAFYELTHARAAMPR